MRSLKVSRACVVSAIAFSAMQAAVLPTAAIGAEICGNDEKRMLRLFEALDLTSGALAEVRGFVAGEQWSEACRALVRHYRGPARDRDPQASKPRPGGTVAAADLVLEDQVTLLNTQGRLARRADGGIDWLDHGPLGDREWNSYLNRHMHLKVLLDAYLETGREEYARRLDEDLADWLVNSPYSGERSPGRRGEGLDLRWLSLEPANRALVWRQIFDALALGLELRDSTLLLMLSSLQDHADFLVEHHSPKHNHLIMEMESLATIAMRWPEFAAADAWIRYSLDQVDGWIEQQFYPDGADRELSAFYQWLVLQRLASYGEILDRAGVPASRASGESLERAHGYLAGVVRPSGTVPLNNDGDLVSALHLLSRIAEREDRPDWLHAATGGRRGEPPQGAPTRFFPWAGQVVMRSGWERDALWSFFDFGPAGEGSHQHADRLHLSVSAFGRDLLVDAGRFTYDRSSAFRDYFRGSASHNVILVDGGGQNTSIHSTASPLLDRVTIEPGLEIARGVYADGFEGAAGEASHFRTVAFVAGELWVVADRIVTDRRRAIQALWHFHPDCSVEIDGSGVHSVDEGVGNLRIAPVGGVAWGVALARGEEEPEIQGWWSEAYGHKRPATAAVFSAEIGAGEETFVWLLQPARGAVPIRRAEMLATDGESVRVSLETAAGEVEVVLPFVDPPSR
ncbi:MAG: hypothetical protein DWQ36_05925 [Acidobacteria bacterium]|nr:MAG: hypothetical protein DWQ30_08595 [Acidobacteriota bacterium]REK09796.1 MAG: hypothetical protein DWQ36_05925 [Acidobacteriota bacterium]